MHRPSNYPHACSRYIDNACMGYFNAFGFLISERPDGINMMHIYERSVQSLKRSRSLSTTARGPSCPYAHIDSGHIRIGNKHYLRDHTCMLLPCHVRVSQKIKNDVHSTWWTSCMGS